MQIQLAAQSSKASMPFQFQQFAIDDRDCAMKVGTDGILLGAWVEIPGAAKNVLDVGTGSGLLSLMLAQRFDSPSITAIEIERRAAQSALANVEASPWANRISVQPISFQQLGEVVGETTDRYDAVVCNPPYFGKDLKPDSEGRRVARHKVSLTTYQLFQLSRQVLSSCGTITLIVPAIAQQEVIQEAAESQFRVNRLTTVSTLPDRPPSRLLIEFGTGHAEVKPQHLVLEESHHRRSAEYARLTKDFFLNP